MRKRERYGPKHNGDPYRDEKGVWIWIIRKPHAKFCRRWAEKKM